MHVQEGYMRTQVPSYIGKRQTGANGWVVIYCNAFMSVMFHEYMFWVGSAAGVLGVSRSLSLYLRVCVFRRWSLQHEERMVA